MSGILDLLQGQLGQTAIEQLGGQLGVDKSQAASVVSGALPLLVQALAKNANQGGAEALAGALENKHDGSILGDVSGFLGGGDFGDGAAILGHVLGGQQSVVSSGLSKATGLDASQVNTALAALAPVVLGAVGKIKSEKGLDASALSDFLGQEKASVEQQDPDAMGVLGKLLDTDNDGDISDDLINIGGKLLGGFLK
ncbi:MAG: DUF937 domain-containing protein [bacterium]|nr:DUF937 domain-containing protein [bacterium]